MKHFGLLGHPLGHTLSPQLHRLLAQEISENNFPGNKPEIDYRVMDIAPEDLDSRTGELISLDGFNITIPYKVRIMEKLDELHESAKRHGAVNVVAVRDGRKIGFNTDCIGFVKTMEQNGIEISGRVCVLGAGGVGRMFATEAALCGCEVTLAVREKHMDEAKRLAEGIKGSVRVCGIEKLGGEYDLLINATPCGMFPKTDASPVGAEILSGVKNVFDCIYNPSETKLMSEAKKAGCKVVGGLGMLVWQAAAAQEIWLGVSFTSEQIDRVMERLSQ